LVLEEAFRAETETENPALQFFGEAYSDLNPLLRWLSSFFPNSNMARNMGVCVGNCQPLVEEATASPLSGCSGDRFFRPTGT
jgi:hypothetical protein